MWVNIIGYRWPYRINEDGVVQKLYGGEWRSLTPFLSTTRARVSMYRADGTRVCMPVVWLMADAFMGGRKPGMCIVHKNGAKLDNRLVNLAFETKREACLRSAGNRRVSVEMIDREGNVVAIYRSLAEAAKKNYISRNSVSARCLKQVKDPFDLIGYSFRYEDPHAHAKRKRRYAS